MIGGYLIYRKNFFPTERNLLLRDVEKVISILISRPVMTAVFASAKLVTYLLHLVRMSGSMIRAVKL